MDERNTPLANSECSETGRSASGQLMKRQGCSLPSRQRRADRYARQLAEPCISPERLTALVEAAEHIHGVWSGISPEARLEVTRQWLKALAGIPAPFVERAFEEWSGKRAPKPRELAEAAATLRQVAVNAVRMSSMPAPAPEPVDEPERGERMTAAEMLASVREKLREGDSAVLRGMEARLAAQVEADNG